MSEGTVHLHREVEILVSQRYVRAQQHLRHGLSGYVTVASVLEVHRSVAIQVGYLIHLAALLIGGDAGAVRQVEHTKGLTHNLVDDVVVAPVEACSVERSERCDVRSTHIGAFVVTRERDEAVLLERHIDVDVEFQVALEYRRDAETDFKTLVAHLSEVGHPLVVGERRHGHFVLIEHIARARVVVFSREHQSVVPCSDIEADVEARACLPFQVGIDVAQLCKRHLRCVFPGHHARRTYQHERVVGLYSAQVSAQTVARAQLEHGELRYAESLEHVPRCRHRGEYAPAVVGSEERAAIGTYRCAERIGVQEGVFGHAKERQQRWRLVVAACVAVWNDGSAGHSVVAHGVVGESFHGGPEAAAHGPVIFGQGGGRELVDSPLVAEVHHQVAQPVLILLFLAHYLAVARGPCGLELIVGYARIAV